MIHGRDDLYHIAIVQVILVLKVAVFFLPANTSAGAGFFFFFMSFVPEFFIFESCEDLAYWEKILYCLLTNTAMALGCRIIVSFEAMSEYIIIFHNSDLFWNHTW